MSYLKTTLLLATIVLLGLVSLSVSVVNAEEFLLADDKDDNITSILAEVLPIAADQLATYDSDVALVYHQRIFNANEDTYELYQNLVWWVQRGDAAEITNFVRDFDPGIDLKKVKAFVIRPGSCDVNAALSAEINRLDKDRIHIQDGDDEERSTNLVVAFDTAKPGDIFGISIKTKVDEQLTWESWLVADDEPVARAEMRIKCDPSQTFVIFGTHFAKNQMQQKIMKKDRDIIQDVRVWADKIAPVFHEAYSPPWFEQSPRLIVAKRGRRFVYEGHYLWWTTSHWNQVAIRMSAYEIAYLKEAEKAAEEAKRLAEGKNPKDQADALYTFVRDELQDRYTRLFTHGDDIPTVDEVLETRAGNTPQKAFLLLAMMRQMDLQASIVWSHDPHRGGFVIDYPYWAQVSAPLVKVRFSDETEIWYDLDCKDCSPGQIQPRLRHTRALTYKSDCDTDDDELFEKSLEDAITLKKNPLALYMHGLKRKDWNKLIYTPGDPEAIVGWQHESLAYKCAPNTESTGILSYTAFGLTPFSEQLSIDGELITAAESMATERFPADHTYTPSKEQPVASDTSRVMLNIDEVAMPEPMGDTWILPADVVFGQPCIRAWPTSRKTIFNIPRSNDQYWEFRIQLPDTWEKVELAQDQTFGFELMQYNITYRQLGRELVVMRSLLERVGDVSKVSSLEVIGQEVEKIRNIELSPLVLRRIVEN